ncbi:LysR family transcriptional regulator, glycine cleavage system transcriptional activator [Modicisalibacter muralis]|uniref:LysR family transcriptional regulator, glycine cleavage system transcriptional activator n=1 Tax=Modicisalibacter muralis TaxID=119000 RepID=A0A1G9JIT7_9GAMM|nr:LysR substrate-binding domain-containing protein [Halomonas muralis]SDL37408.1 LysR family transcriptional regulator, glycine cleavage system transcriptional activator [Halomonas muralis]
MTPRRLPSLSALRAFEATARHLSAKAAAEELSVTPTAVSHQIRKLEEYLGVVLFVRKPRQLVLTGAGKTLLAASSDAFDTLGDAVARLYHAPEQPSVTLSTTPAVAARWLLPWVCLLRERHPDLNLNIQVSYDWVALDGVAADMAIRYGDGHWPGLVTEKLFDNVFVPACSPALGISRHADLHHHTLLHYRPPSRKGSLLSWLSWQKLANVAGLDIDAGLMFSDETHTIGAALDGQGVALMSKALIASELSGGRLVQPFGPDMPAEPFHLVYPQERLREPAFAAVREWVLGLADRAHARSDVRASNDAGR